MILVKLHRESVALSASLITKAHKTPSNEKLRGKSKCQMSLNRTTDNRFDLLTAQLHRPQTMPDALDGSFELLVALFYKAQGLQRCSRRCVTGGDFGGFQSLPTSAVYSFFCYGSSGCEQFLLQYQALSARLPSNGGGRFYSSGKRHPEKSFLL